LEKLGQSHAKIKVGDRCNVFVLVAREAKPCRGWSVMGERGKGYKLAKRSFSATEAFIVIKSERRLVAMAELAQVSCDTIRRHGGVTRWDEVLKKLGRKAGRHG